MKYTKLLLMALLLNWTALYAQVGKVFIVNGDTLIGYTKFELKKIATKIVEAQECDTTLKIAEQQLVLKDTALAAKDSALVSKDSVIVNKNNIIDLNQDIITGQKVEIVSFRKAFRKEKRSRTWIKIGWVTTSVVLTGLLIINQTP